MLVYSSKVTPRSRYSIKTTFKTLLLYDELKFTSNLEDYLQFSGPKFSYGSKSMESGVHFIASGLLEQKGIKEQDISIGENEGLVTLFAHRQEAALPYDPFSAIFYMLSRYEEYLPHLRDQYDRFTVQESLAKRNNFLQTAVVDRWANQVKNALLEAFPKLEFQERSYNYIPTLDIDNAYAFKEKGFMRSIAGFLKNSYRLDFERLTQQLRVLFAGEQDPYDTYNYQLNIQKKYNLKPIYFFLLGDYGLNDKNLSHENRSFQSLIKSIADYALVGIHPSFASNSDKDKLHLEVLRLERIVKRDVFRSRQHFLKLSLPETYRNLIEEDIEEDYTMGFANELGFRAGTCTPYLFFDLDGEVERKLKVFPFQVMEATLKYYLKSTPDEAIEKIQEMIREVKSVKGTFISLWHNESLSDQHEWKGWRKIYEEMTKLAIDKE